MVVLARDGLRLVELESVRLAAHTCVLIQLLELQVFGESLRRLRLPFVSFLGGDARLRHLARRTRAHSVEKESEREEKLVLSSV